MEKKLTRKMTFKIQKKAYSPLCKEFLLKYNLLNKKDNLGLVEPLWKKYRDELKKLFLPFPPLDFLRNETIKETMFVVAGGDWLAKQINFLEKNLSFNELKSLLHEDYIGEPKIMSLKYCTSHSSIHHLYHLINFQKKTGADIKNYKSVLEWGGGYGDMAKIIKRINPNITYIIIDLPLFCCVQWFYLSSILGKKEVQLITNKKMPILKNKINILPLNFILEYKLDTDIFIATWSLSESSKIAQNLVDSSNFFNAKHILLAFQENTKDIKYASNLKKIAEKHHANIESMTFLPENHPKNYYAFF